MTGPNDWEIKKCLRMSVAFLLATAALLLLGISGFYIPVLTQVVGFIFLTFVPGILILRILKIHNVNAIETLGYSVGLSIAFVMFTGLFANFVLPLIGILQPISVLPLMATIAIFTVILGALAYRRDRDFAPASSGVHFDIRNIMSPYYLPLFLLPVIAIVGAHLVNIYQNNSLLLFFIIAVACVVALVAFDKLPRGAYPLAVALIGLSLLLHITLISTQLSGYIIHLEYYFENLVVQNGYWDFTIREHSNSVVSVVLLWPTYSLLLNMHAIWVVKIIYPLIFCLVPVLLFHIFRGQVGDKKAFLATFFFMSVPIFFTIVTEYARQQVAELFFALIILLMIDRSLALNQRIALTIIFVMSLIVSHYALGYIVLAFLLGAWAVVALMRSGAGRKLWRPLTRKGGALPEILTSQSAFPHKIMAVIIAVYLLFGLGWYGGIAGGSVLNTIRQITHEQYSLLSEELPVLVESIELPGPTEPAQPAQPASKFFDPSEREALIATALGLDFASASPWDKAFRIFQYLTELFIAVGFFVLVLRPRRFKFKAEYMGFVMVAALILLACIVVPRVSRYLDITRFYHVCLFSLAPLCILGAECIWQRALSLARRVTSSQSHQFRLVALAILIPYFIFTSGFVFEVTQSTLGSFRTSPYSLALSSYRIDMPVFTEHESEAVAWLAERADCDVQVYADEYGRLLLYDRLLNQVGKIPASGEVPDEAYVFLRRWNTQKRQVHIATRQGPRYPHSYVDIDDMPALLTNRKLVYNNGGAQIWSPVKE
jgi:uncharacterized membrane protein